MWLFYKTTTQARLRVLPQLNPPPPRICQILEAPSLDLGAQLVGAAALKVLKGVGIWNTLAVPNAMYTHGCLYRGLGRYVEGAAHSRGIWNTLAVPNDPKNICHQHTYVY